MKHFSVLIAALFIGNLQVSAVPAYPHPRTYTQSDGTQITIRIVGDEYRHYTLSQDGYTLTGGVDNDLYYATLSQDGRLVPTNIKARPLGNLTAADRAAVSKMKKGIKPFATNKLSTTRRRVKAPQTRADGKIAPPARISSAQTLGKLKSVVILINFKDTKYTTPNPKQAIQNLLMQDGYSVNGATGSAWNYYQDNSNKQFDPEFVVVGPYTVSQKSSYYAGSDGTANASTMIVEAAKLANADINFQEYADNGVIRDVFVFYAGENQAEGGPKSTVWPHRWNLSEDYAPNNSVYLDEQHLDGYACSSELNYNRDLAGIGTFCHEFGHVLGWHDFYDTDYEGSGGESPALENFSLMCSGSYNNEGRTPPAVNILERWIVGWTEPVDISKGGGTFLLDPVWKDKGYLVRTPTSNDYFLIENRAAGSFKWDNYIENANGSIENTRGMLVYHVDYTKPSVWTNNTLNDNPSHECMKLVRSVPGASSAGSPSKTFFPGSRSITTLSSTSNKDYNSWKNESPLLNFTSISLVGEQIKLVSPSANPYSVSANQYDALIEWQNPDGTEWQITWSETGKETLGTKTVNGSALHIEGLTPDTNYEVTLKSGTTQYTESFTTGSVSENYGARISIPEGGFRSSDPIVLSVLDVAGKITSTEWAVDDKKTTESYLTLPAGEHKLTATITTVDGTKKHIIKYITVE